MCRRWMRITWLTCSAILLTGLISGPSFPVSDHVHDGDLAALASALLSKANHSQNGTAGSIASAAPVNLLETQIRGPLLGQPNQNLWAWVPRNYLSISFLEVLYDYKDEHSCLRTTCYRWVSFGPEAHSGELAWVDEREPFVVSGKTETDVSLGTESRFGSRVPDHPWNRQMKLSGSMWCSTSRPGVPNWRYRFQSNGWHHREDGPREWEALAARRAADHLQQQWGGSLMAFSSSEVGRSQPSAVVRQAADIPSEAGRWAIHCLQRQWGGPLMAFSNSEVGCWRTFSSIVDSGEMGRTVQRKHWKIAILPSEWPALEYLPQLPLWIVSSFKTGTV